MKKLNFIKKNNFKTKLKKLKEKTKKDKTEIYKEGKEKFKKSKGIKEKFSLGATMIKSVIKVQIKALILGLISFIMSFILMIIWPLMLLIIFLVLFYYIYLMSLGYGVNKDDGIKEGNLHKYSGVDGENTGIYYKPLTDAKPFIAQSKIPHGNPATGRITQGYCSNFSSWKPGQAWVYKTTGMKYDQLWCDLYGPNSYRNLRKKLGGTVGNFGNHGGLDIGNSSGPVVFSTNKGKVIQASYDGLWGNSVVITGEDYEGNPLVVRYSHLDKIYAKIDTEVEAGDQIGKMGSTGDSTGIHLHYGICENTTNWSSCYSSFPGISKLEDFKIKIVNPFKYILNYEINGKTEKGDSNIVDGNIYFGQLFKSGISVGLDVEASIGDYLLGNSNGGFGDLDPNKIATREDLNQMYVKTALETGVSPDIIRGMHYRENSNLLRNPKLKPCGMKGWSCENEGLFGFYSDIAGALNDPTCKKTNENFGKPNEIVTIKELNTQLKCAVNYMTKIKISGHAKDRINKKDQKKILEYLHWNNFDTSDSKKNIQLARLFRARNGSSSYYRNNLDKDHMYIGGKKRDGLARYTKIHRGELMGLLKKAMENDKVSDFSLKMDYNTKYELDSDTKFTSGQGSLR